VRPPESLDEPSRRQSRRVDRARLHRRAHFACLVRTRLHTGSPCSILNAGS
jgi:hypothetical protein